MVGDDAYLVPDTAPTPVEALRGYAALMDDWVAAVREGRDLSQVFPVAAEATEANASALATRLATLRAEILPAFQKT